jgi:hypothetical protein
MARLYGGVTIRTGSRSRAAGMPADQIAASHGGEGRATRCDPEDRLADFDGGRDTGGDPRAGRDERRADGWRLEIERLAAP